MYSTSNFCAGLLASVIGYMTENKVAKFPVTWLAYEHYVKGTSEIAKDFVEKGHWEYFFIKNGKLCLHKNYHGDLGLSEYDYEITNDIVCYDTVSEVFGNRNIMTIHTTDWVNLIRVCYDTIGNIHFPKEVDCFDASE